MKIVFFGTPYFVDPVLKKLEKNFDVVEKIREPKEFNNETVQQLCSLSPDLFVVAAYGQILSSKLLEVPRLGAINIHPSLLPKYRGPSPIQSAILNGDKKTGVTFIKMDEQVDHGPIIAQFGATIEPADTFESLAQRLFEQAALELESTIINYNANQTGKPQDDSKATFTKPLTKQDGYIDLSSLEIARPEKPWRSGGNWKLEIARKIRAYHPWPGIWTHLRLNSGGQAKIIKLLPGKKLQVEGKKPMSYKDFINGYPNGEEFLKKIGLL